MNAGSTRSVAASSRAAFVRAGRLLGRLHLPMTRTWRIRGQAGGRMMTPDQYVFGPEIYAICERDVLALTALARWQPFMLMIAPGRDGDWASGAAESFGGRVVRGATGRGGRAALQRLVESLDGSSQPATIVVDGPVGPHGAAQPGAILCASRLRRPLIPVAAAARPAVVFSRTWSRLYLPLPGARVMVVCGEPLETGRSESKSGLRADAAELSRRLAQARELAEALLRDRASEGRRRSSPPVAES